MLVLNEYDWLLLWGWKGVDGLLRVLRGRFVLRLVVRYCVRDDFWERGNVLYMGMNLVINEDLVSGDVDEWNKGVSSEVMCDGSWDVMISLYVIELVLCISIKSNNVENILLGWGVGCLRDDDRWLLILLGILNEIGIACEDCVFVDLFKCLLNVVRFGSLLIWL